MFHMKENQLIYARIVLLHGDLGIKLDKKEESWKLNKNKNNKKFRITRHINKNKSKEKELRKKLIKTKEKKIDIDLLNVKVHNART